MRPPDFCPRRAADNAAVPDTSKVCSAEEAVALIPDGVWLTPSGFVGTSCPELLLNALRCVWGIWSLWGIHQWRPMWAKELLLSAGDRCSMLFGLLLRGQIARRSCLPAASFTQLTMLRCRQRFEATGSPRNLGLIWAASVGDSKGRGERVACWL